MSAVNSHGHEIRPYYSTGIELPLLIGVVDAGGVEHSYVSKREWAEERKARLREVSALKVRIDELESLIREMLHGLRLDVASGEPITRYGLEYFEKRCGSLGLMEGGAE